MKFLVSISFIFGSLGFGKVGPDLSKGTNIGYFTELRFDYAKNPKSDYFPVLSLSPERERLVQSYREGIPEEVIAIADSWLKKCPIDADVHLMVAMCYKEMGDFSSYSYHLGVFYGLLQSITSEGDGLSTETAFKVVSINEEYSLIGEIGAKLEQQTLVRNCDKMDLTRRDGDVKFTLYFDVTTHLAALARNQNPNEKKSKNGN